MNHHIPSAQGDGHPGTTTDRADVALAICLVVALAQEHGISCATVLAVIAETWDKPEAVDLERVRHAADRITS